MWGGLRSRVRAIALGASLLSCGASAASIRPGPSAPADVLCVMCHHSSSGACLEAGHGMGDQAQCEAAGCIVTRTPARPCRELASYCEPSPATP